MIQTKGKIYDAVKALLQEKGHTTDTLQIVTFGRTGTWRDIMLNGEHIGSYEIRGKRLVLLGRDK